VRGVIWLGALAAVVVGIVGLVTLGAGSEAEASAADTAVRAPDTVETADTAVFAGGCFWCMEPPYDGLDGVLATISGYAGGDVADPSYEQVTAGGTGHREAVMVVYDSDRITYSDLLPVFWRNVDPLDDGGQFCDRGFSYTTAIFAQDSTQAAVARASKEGIEDRFSEPVVTPVELDRTFYPAEEYHQNYYEKKPLRYRFYRTTCGRDGRLDELWGS